MDVWMDGWMDGPMDGGMSEDTKYVHGTWMNGSSVRLHII